MTSPKRIFKLAILAVALCTRSVFGQTDDVQSVVHEKVDYYTHALLKFQQWDTDKKMLASYPPEQVVRALIAEIDRSRGTLLRDKGRDGSVYGLFQALDLPPALVTAELDKPQTPERKASLMQLLRHSKDPGVVPALLRHLGDLRPVVQLEGWPTEHARSFPFRVRDGAYNTLITCFDLPNPHYVGRLDNALGRDIIIRETLAQLHLSEP